MKSKSILFISSLAFVSGIYGYSWRITNGTSKSLYIYLGNNNSASKAPIGKENIGVLIEPDQSIGSSERLPNTFTRLVIGQDQFIYHINHTYRLNDAHNINYSIEETGDVENPYMLVDNNSSKDLRFERVAAGKYNPYGRNIYKTEK